MHIILCQKSRHAEIFWEDVKKKMFPKNRFDLTAQNHLLGFQKELLILSNCSLGRLPKNRFNASVLKPLGPKHAGRQFRQK